MELQERKAYLIITPSISNLGGAQLYVLRRAKYLIYNGYSVKVLVSNHNSTNFILEKQFASIPVLFLSELQNPISFYTQKKLDDLIQKVKFFLDYSHNGIIETSSLETSIWGELIGSKFNWKHILYLLAEPRIDHFIYYPGYDFFQYKLARGEFFGTSEYTLPLIFGRPVIKEKNNFVNVPFDPKELSGKSDPPIDTMKIDQESFIIGTITRLEKPYLKPFIESCIRFADQHKERKITLIIAGGSENTKLFNQLKETYNNYSLRKSNLVILFTGYIKTLGRDFFRKLDVFVGMGTASINAISQGCATLNMDPDTDKCSGIFGIDTDNFAYPKNGKTYLVEDKLESLMTDNQLLKNAKLKGTSLFTQQYSVSFCFNKLDHLIEMSDNKNQFYPFRVSRLDRIKDKLKFIKLKFKINIKKWLLS